MFKPDLYNHNILYVLYTRLLMLIYNERTQNNKWNFGNQILVLAAGVSTNKLGSVEHSHDLDHGHDHSPDPDHGAEAVDQEERQGRSQYLGQLEQGEDIL